MSNVESHWSRLRGKSLSHHAVTDLWRGVPSPSEEIVASRSDAADGSGVPSANTETGVLPKARSPIAPPAGEKPRNVAEWVKANRFLRGAIIKPSQRRILLEEDVVEILRPRCGNWRFDSSKVPGFPERLRSGFGWLTQPPRGWNKRSLVLYIASSPILPIELDETKCATAISRAIATWNDADVGVELSISHDESLADIVVDWNSPNSDPHGAISSRVVGHGDYPPPYSIHSGPPLPVCFNRNETWNGQVDNDSATAAYDLESICLHELGHCIGLQHLPDGIMREFIDTGLHRDLDSDTIAAAKELYAAGLSPLI